MNEFDLLIEDAEDEEFNLLIEESEGVSEFDSLVDSDDSPPKENNPFYTIGKSAKNAFYFQGMSGLSSTKAAVLSAASRFIDALNPDGEGVVPGTVGKGAVFFTKEELDKDRDDTKKATIEALNVSKEWQNKGAKYTEGLVSSLGDIESGYDAMLWASYAIGQAVGQIPASVATMGISSFVLETGEIYMASVEKIAKEKGLTMEQVIEQGLDDPAASMAYGTMAAGLERIGAGKVVKAVSKSGVMRELKKRGLDVLKTGGFESVTEGAQSVIEQVGASRSAGQSWSQAFSDINPMEIVESAAQGFVGGGGLTTVSNVAGAVKEKAQEKIADKIVKSEDNAVALDKRVEEAEKTTPKKENPVIKTIVDSGKEKVPQDEKIQKLSEFSDKELQGALDELKTIEKPDFSKISEQEQQDYYDNVVAPTDLLKQSLKPITESTALQPRKLIEETRESTSARKAQLNVDRESVGLNELNSPERKAWETTLNNAKEKKLDEKALRIADEVTKNPRSLNDEETAGLVIKTADLKNEHKQAVADIGTLEGVDAQLKGAEIERIQEEFEAVTTALKMSGTEKGRTLAAQKLTINKDFDLLSVLNRAKAANQGKGLSTKQKQKFATLTKTLEEQSVKIESLEKSLAEKTASDKISGRNKFTKMSAQEKASNLNKTLARAKQLLKEGCSVSG